MRSGSQMADRGRSGNKGDLMFDRMTKRLDELERTIRYVKLELERTIRYVKLKWFLMGAGSVTFGFLIGAILGVR